MTWYYFWEIAVTGIFDNLFICFCIAVFYYLGKWDRRKMADKIIWELTDNEEDE